ncbi:TRAP transporter small permease [Devosia sp.]|uniref:TRAP transporter small permease n=1 Tax=Devosia sp. TaxID=1871048 RepID=UPI002735F7B3|nr:TRAP transporter small permease [Devosia sp.]MDP2781541.1 TRAP transporter small permease [Devosia sp.]
MRQLGTLLEKIEELLLATIMLGMVALYASSIVIREVVPTLSRNVAWVDEATRYLMVWMVFLALGIALQRGRQIAMTSFIEPLPEAIRILIGRVIDLVGLIFCLYIAWVGASMVGKVAASGQHSPTLGISAAWLYMALPVGFLLLALRYGLSLVGAFDRRVVTENSELPQ